MAKLLAALKKALVFVLLTPLLFVWGLIVRLFFPEDL